MLCNLSNERWNCGWWRRTCTLFFMSDVQAGAWCHFEVVGLSDILAVTTVLGVARWLDSGSTYITTNLLQITSIKTCAPVPVHRMYLTCSVHSCRYISTTSLRLHKWSRRAWSFYTVTRSFQRLKIRSIFNTRFYRRKGGTGISH